MVPASARVVASRWLHLVLLFWGQGCQVQSQDGSIQEHGNREKLVGGLEHFFPYIRNVIIPIDELILFREVGSTTKLAIPS